MDPVGLLLLGSLIAIFYFLIWRPQSKRKKEQQALMDALTKGDEVVTAGGIMGTVTRVDADIVRVRVSNNVEIRMQKQAIQATIPKGTLKNLDAN